MRSGRVRIGANAATTIIHAGFNAAPRAYRVYNSGRDTKDPITVIGANKGVNFTVAPRESADFFVETVDIQVQAGANGAEVLYDFLG